MAEQGALLGGRYQLGSVLGRGGMAEVRRARDTRLGREVAIKQLRTDLAGDDTFQARFRREAQSAAGLNHPNIVSVYDTGEQRDPQSGVSVPYIVMELVVGHTLRDLLREGRKLRPERALELTIGVLDALQYSHQQGIIHRDIKPANVMLTSSGQVKVMDFGIARAVADTSASMTQTAAVIGTAQYLSPEQARGEKNVDNRSDIYAAGCLLYELLVGQPPFQGDSPVSVAYQHVREMPVPPSYLDPELTPAMDTITLKALAKNPADRYQNAREMRDDITRLLGGQQPTAQLMASPVQEPVTPVQPLRPVTSPISARTAASPQRAVEVAEPQDEEQPPPRRRIGAGVVITVLALVLAGGLAAGYLLFWRTGTVDPAPSPSVAQVLVPQVRSMSQQNAVATLEENKLKAEVKTVAGADDNTLNTVIDQLPAKGASVPEGSTVTITVNVGPKKVAIPSGLVGQDKGKAKAALERAGFTKVTLTEASDEKSDAVADTVTSVNPAEGAVVPLTQSITLYYATGKSEVPDVSGFGRDAAVSRLKSAGFSKVVTEERESSAGAGTVIETDPKAGTRVDRTQQVKVYLAKTAADPSPTPSVSPSVWPSSTPSSR